MGVNIIGSRQGHTVLRGHLLIWHESWDLQVLHILRRWLRKWVGLFLLGLRATPYFLIFYFLRRSVQEDS